MGINTPGLLISYIANTTQHLTTTSPLHIRGSLQEKTGLHEIPQTPNLSHCDIRSAQMKEKRYDKGRLHNNIRQNECPNRDNDGVTEIAQDSKIPEGINRSLTGAGDHHTNDPQSFNRNGENSRHTENNSKDNVDTKSTSDNTDRIPKHDFNQIMATSSGSIGSPNTDGWTASFPSLPSPSFSFASLKNHPIHLPFPGMAQE